MKNNKNPRFFAICCGWDKFLANKKTNKKQTVPESRCSSGSYRPRNEVREQQFVSHSHVCFSRVNWPNLLKTRLVFDRTHACDSLPCCLSSLSVDALLVVPLRMETLQSLLKILAVYLKETRKLSAEIRSPSWFCCSAAEARHNKRSIQTIAPGVNGKRRRRASTHACLLFRSIQMYEA